MNGSHTLRSWTKGGKKMASAEQLKFELLAVDRASRPIQQVQGRVRNFDRQIKQSSIQMNQFGGSVTGAQKSLRKFAMGGVQQAGYQIGDYAVQVANGTSATQAFGQQAGQFFQIFGPFGAVLGAAISVFSAFKMAADKAGASVDNVGKKIDLAKNSIDAFRQSSELANISSGELTKQYGMMASQAKELFEVQNEINRLAAFRDVGTAVELATKSFGDFGDRSKSAIYGAAAAFAELNEKRESLQLLGEKSPFFDITRTLPTQLMAVNEALNEHVMEPVVQLAKEFGITTDQAALLADTVQDAQTARSLQERVAALIKTRNIYKDLALADGEISESEQERLNTLLQAQMSYIKIHSELRESAGAYVDILGSEQGLAQAVQAANQLYQNRLGTIDTTANDYVDILGSEKGLSEAIAANNKLYADRLAAKQSEIAAARASFMVEASVTVAETERAKAIKEMQEAYAKIMGGDKGSEGIKKTANAIKTELNPELMRIKDASEMVGQSFENAFMSIAEGTMTAKDAFKTMARDIISELYRIFVVKQITGMIQSAVGLMGGPNPFAFKAIGGPVQSDKPYVVGERGPEMFVPSRSGSIVPNNKLGGGGVVVNQTINVTTGVQQTVRAEVMGLMPQIAEASKAAVLDAKRRGGAFAGAF